MWNGLVSYFSNPCLKVPENAALPETKTSSSDWVFVDLSGKEICETVADKELQDGKKQHGGRRLSPLPLLDLTNRRCSPQRSSSSSPSVIEEEWFITPPPCFVLSCPIQLEITPLENLLIEHPSMSVYSELPGCHSTKLEETFSEIIDGSDNSELVSSAPNVSECHNFCSSLSKSSTVVKPLLKGFLAQMENLKLLQKAKYHKEQYKFRPSFIKRQNFVRCARSSVCLKKKILVKPFGEKCKRSF